MKSVSGALEETHSSTIVRPGHLDRLGERFRLEDEHVRPLGEPRVGLARREELRRLLLVGGTGGHDVAEAQHRAEEPRPRGLHGGALGRELAHGAVVAADRRHRVSRVVGVAPRLGGAVRRLARQQAVGVQVEAGLLGPRERPLVLVAPAPAVVELPERRLAAGAAAHDEDRGRAPRPRRRRRPRGASGRRTRAAPRSSARRPRRSPARNRRRASRSRRRASRRGSTAR